MRPTATPRLLALAMAMLPRNFRAARRLPPSPSPMMAISPHHHAGLPHARLGFVDPTIRPFAKNDNGSSPRSKIETSPSEENVPPSRMAMSSSSSSSSSSASSRRTSPSPWSPGSWKITLDFGREEPTSSSFDRNDDSRLSNALGEGWGSNGGRLALSFEAMATAETNNARSSEDEDDDGDPVRMAWLGGKPTGTVECIPRETNGERDYGDCEDCCASYVNEGGLQNVRMSSGRWRIEPPLPLLPSHPNALPGQASTLRFHLTLLTPVRRNSISFAEDQILLLGSNAFRTEQYSSGVRTLLPYQRAKDASQRRLEEQLDHETGDRRLDGNDVLETLGGYRDVAELVLERDERRRKWKEIEGALPRLGPSVGIGRKVDVDKLMEEKDRWGIWPGDTEFMTMERGVILAPIAKGRKPGLFPWMGDGGGVEEPVVVGKWSAEPK